MTDVTIQFVYRVGGTLTDPTSVVLSDSGSTYGVKRTDTNAVIVSAGTAMTHASTGVYTYTFTPPVQGLTYSWWAKVVRNGVTSYFEQEATDPASAADGYYATQADLSARFTDANLAVLSNLDGSSASINTTTIGNALSYADQTIDLYLRRNGYSVPVPTDSDDFPRLTEAACNFAMAHLYGKREWRETEGDTNPGAIAYGRNSYHKAGRMILTELGIYGLDADLNQPEADPVTPVVVT